MMSTIKHGPLYLTKRLRDRMDVAGFSGTITIEDVEPTPRLYDNPAWPDLTERFTPTMAGLPEPEPDLTAWRNPWFWSVLLTFYALVIALICLLVTGGTWRFA